MSYRLEFSPQDRKDAITSCLQKWEKENIPDVTLVPEDGQFVLAHSLLLSMHSSTLRTLMSSISSSSSTRFSVSVPVSSVSLSGLLQLLSTGFVIGNSRKEVELVQETALVLGMKLDWQIGYKRIKVEKKDFTDYSQNYIDIRGNNSLKEEEGEEVEFSCEVCGKRYAHIGHLKRHMANTEGEIFSCTECPQKFHEKRRLSKHVESNHGNGEDAWYQCQECPQKLVDIVKLEKHIEIKHGNMDDDESVGPFVCQECSEQFEKKNELRIHLRSHIVKSLACSECDKTFSRRDKLNIHLKNKHMGTVLNINVPDKGETQDDTVERNHECDECLKRFTCKNHLVRHQSSVHSGIMYGCDDCEKKFSRKDKLNLHKRKMHGA